MACNKKIVASIQNACRSIKGLKEKSWIFNRTDFTFNKTNNTVTSIAKIGSVVAFTATGYKDYINAGHDGVVAENMPTMFTHKWTASLTAETAAARANIDNADDIVVVVESNDGSLLVYGVDHGLWKASQSQMSNDNNALTAVEFSSREGMTEDYSVYFYTGTKASLVALES